MCSNEVPPKGSPSSLFVPPPPNVPNSTSLFHFSQVPNVFSLCYFQVPNLFSICSRMIWTQNIHRNVEVQKRRVNWQAG
jgi:hypothetical protein